MFHLLNILLITSGIFYISVSLIFVFVEHKGTFFTQKNRWVCIVHIIKYSISHGLSVSVVIYLPYYLTYIPYIWTGNQCVSVKMYQFLINLKLTRLLCAHSEHFNMLCRHIKQTSIYLVPNRLYIVSVLLLPNRLHIVSVLLLPNHLYIVCVLFSRIYNKHRFGAHSPIYCVRFIQQDL